MRRNMLSRVILLALLISPSLLAAEPTAWKSPTTFTSKTPADWWSLFQDAELLRLIEEAKTHYPGHKSVLARVEASRAALRIARADWFPRVTGVGDLNRARFSDTLYAFSFGSLTSYTAMIDVSYEVDIWGRIRGNVGAAKSAAYSAEADAHGLALMLSSEVAKLYFGIKAIDSEKAVLQSTLQLRQEALKLAAARLEAGATNELDRVRAEAELASTEAELAALIAPRAELENTLALALGKKSTDYRFAASALTAPLPNVPAIVPAELIERRPDVASAKALLDAAQLKVGSTRASYLPKLSLAANAGTQTSQASRFTEDGSRIWTVGMKVTIPLFVGGQKKAAIQAAEAAVKEVTGLYEEKVLTAFKEVETCLAKVAAQTTQHTAQQRLLTAAQAAATLARQRYTEGVATYLEVIEAERTSLTAQRALITLRGQRLLATIQLIQALGGGWSTTGTPTAPQSSK
jgi:outer membrane protein, multidrug efflux system